MVTDIKDTARPVEARAILDLLPARPRLLALGEPTHGENTLLDLRNDVFRELAEHEGYRTIAIESDCLKALLVDDYVTTGTGTLDDVMTHGFSHDWGAHRANRDLVRWMRAHNATRPAAEHVRFAGFDGPFEVTHAESPREALTALHAHLALDTGDLDRLLGPDTRWTDQAAMFDPARSPGRSPEARQLRLMADDLTALLGHRPHSARADLYARSATALLRYHHWMADPTPDRMSRLCAQRDATMAHNLLALTERGPTFVHAHNAHLQREKSSMRMWQDRAEWWSAGALVDARLGQDYAFAATALGTLHHRGVDTPPPDTLEGHLHEVPHDRYVVDPAHLQAARPRESPWFGYAPLDPAHLPAIDALVYVRDA
ncbi:erythromycin esterase [Streptomyces sp. V2]|uniref:erythromycin esterase family protein n=2 Tax=Streptomyces TaxID=1883 RepID=UPI000D670996|nr:erythromycin esterase family protein [Streptomyces sp. V2]PWG13531.1 erythromycin esterase [Streptomyces sp. V2]